MPESLGNLRQTIHKWRASWDGLHIRPETSPGHTVFSRRVPAELPSDPKVLHDFGWSAYSLGKVNEARQAMQRVIAAGPDSKPIQRRQIVS